MMTQFTKTLRSNGHWFGSTLPTAVCRLLLAFLLLTASTAFCLLQFAPSKLSTRWSPP